MRKDRRAQLVTLLVLLAALGIAVARKPGWRLPLASAGQAAQASQTPQGAIYAMLAAARTGDVKAYLASYTGPMEAALRQSLAETTEPRFAEYLRDSQTSIKGVAVSDPQKTGDLEAQVLVELIYQDRNEAQTMYLTKTPGGWKITRADTDERVKTLIPYGTPVR